nr:CoA-binding protein [candidate division Zixibacteria bacterium]
MDQTIQNFISAKNLAVIGISLKSKKFGNAVYETLKQKPYNVFPIHHRADAIGGNRTYRDIHSLPPEVDSVVVCLRPDKAAPALANIEKSGIKRVWLQQGANFSEIEKELRKKGIETVSRKCILMYAAPVEGLHAFHRFIWKLLGKL